MDLLTLGRKMFTIYYERNKEQTGQAKTKKSGKGKAIENFKKSC
jgi:hypothetical protein